MKNLCKLGLSRHPPQRDKRAMTEHSVWRSSQSEMNDQYTEEELRKINELQREFFNRYVDLFEPPLPEGVPDRLKAIVKAGAIQKADKVLDVGTGSGILIRYILEYGPSEIHASDLAENMLRRVNEKYPQIKTHQCDLRDLALPGNKIDAIFINGCFSNIVDKERGLENCRRILKPGGRLVISHPLGSAFILRLRELAPFPLDALPEERHASEMLKHHGFKMAFFRDEPEFYLVVGKKRGVHAHD